MYLDHFGLQRFPFGNTPDAGLFFTGGGRGALADALLYSVLSGEGITKVTGGVGVGKTTLCCLLAERLPQEMMRILIRHPSSDPDELSRVLLRGLQPGGEDVGGGSLFSRISDQLERMDAAGQRAVLLMDEAQTLTLPALEWVRRVSNLETASRKLLPVVLFGQPDLDRKLRESSVGQLQERIANSLVIPPLSVTDVRRYLDGRLRACGYRGIELFSVWGWSLLSRYSRGLPRRVNTLAHKALLAAFARGRFRVGWRDVRLAIRDWESGREGSRGRRPGPVSLAKAATFLLAAVVVSHHATLPPEVSVGGRRGGEVSPPVDSGSGDSYLDERLARVPFIRMDGWLSVASRGEGSAEVSAASPHLPIRESEGVSVTGAESKPEPGANAAQELGTGWDVVPPGRSVRGDGTSLSPALVTDFGSGIDRKAPTSGVLGGDS
ncbi:MAG: AAA family ATPase [Magnetococcales bacterium]|nr:AAA family ATPase [Magnetococcales bacterium]